jgi:hypothetical protein
MTPYSVSKYEVIESSDGKKIDMFNADIPASNVSVRICGGVVLSKSRLCARGVMPMAYA